MFSSPIRTSNWPSSIADSSPTMDFRRTSGMRPGMPGQVRRHVPDVLVLDCELPWGDAMGILACLQEDDLSLPVILTTWNTSPESVRQLVVPPVVRCLRKFFPLPALLDGIHLAVKSDGVVKLVSLDLSYSLRRLCHEKTDVPDWHPRCDAKCFEFLCRLQQESRREIAEQKDLKTGPNAEQQGQVLETVDLTPGKPISPEDQAKVSSLGLKILGHVSKAQQDIQAKNVDGAKKELTQATTLLAILKKVLPTINVIDHIWVAKTNLDYVNTTEVQQDLIAIETSIDQLYAVLPAGKAKEHAKLAKDVLKKEKDEGSPEGQGGIGGC